VKEIQGFGAEMHGKGRVTTLAKTRKKGTFNPNGDARVRVAQRSKTRSIRRPRLPGDGGLSGGRNHLVQAPFFKNKPRPLRDAEPGKTSSRKESGVGFPGGDFFETGIYVPAKFGESGTGEMWECLSASPRASRGDESGSGRVAAPNQNIGGIGAGEIARNRETGREIGRKILGAVDSNVSFMREKRIFEFGCEKPLAAVFFERPRLLAVARCGEIADDWRTV
jgi:hypothetical protein